MMVATLVAGAPADLGQSAHDDVGVGIVVGQSGFDLAAGDELQTLQRAGGRGAREF